VGKRRAVAAPEIPVETTPATPYVGKRRAAASEPAPAAVEIRPQPAAPTVEGVAVAAVSGPTLGVPAPRRTLDAPVERLGTITVETRVETAATPAVAPLETEADTSWRDLRIDTGSLPPFEETAAYATDFSAETTTHLPVISTGKRRAAVGTPTKANPLVKRLPSAPLALGIASLAIAVGGAITAAHAPNDTHTDAFVAASALTGASDVGQVGGGRGATVSRSDDRTDGGLADQAAKDAAARAAALNNINAKATGVDQWKAANQWTLPVTAGDYHLTGRFNDVSGLWATVHTGLDFAAPTGTPIHAVASGTITEVGWAGAYGNRTVETLPDGTELWYAHQVEFGTSVGAKVTEGQVIGYVGSTGNTTGPHVHLEVRPGGGDPVDPDTALKAHGIDPDANQ
jgi:hypothetical protein